MPANSFDVVYCSHVLEHVPDDRAAMRELRRALSPNGWAVFMVPITAPVSFEDPHVTRPEDRESIFGQRDHVRRYGPDFRSRLGQAGFKVRAIHARDVVTQFELGVMSIDVSDLIFFATL
jgi:SAM-dependent methyltransferase